jgi:hypothetical protein
MLHPIATHYCMCDRFRNPIPESAAASDNIRLMASITGGERNSNGGQEVMTDPVDVNRSIEYVMRMSAYR